MVKQFTMRRLLVLMSTAGVVCFNQSALATGFQLWEQDGASIGNYHAGRAAIADDASTAYYNPAGLIRIKNQQMVFGADPIMTDFRYNGTVAVDTLIDPISGDLNVPQPAAAQGGGFNLVPFFHYAAPINNCVVFGFSIDAPFGLKTDYGNNTVLRYAASLTSLQIIDVSPSLGVALTDKLSVGAGVDWQRAQAQFNQTAVAFFPSMDTLSNNDGHSQAWGYHAGILYQFTPQTRVGVSYQSKVTHHIRGKSLFSGPLANGVEGGNQVSEYVHVNATLPATTSLSLFHSFNCQWDAMGSLSYTQWNVFRDLILQNVAGIEDGNATNSLNVIIPQAYHNTWNYAVGANYHPTAQWTLRTGLGFDQSPSNNRYRNVQLPDSDRIAIALGGHYQATRTIGFDLGWTHLFAMNTHINNLTQQVGDEKVTTNGSVQANADVYGLEMKWDLV